MKAAIALSETISASITNDQKHPNTKDRHRSIKEEKEREDRAQSGMQTLL
jgi:hypothetical protein